MPSLLLNAEDLKPGQLKVHLYSGMMAVRGYLKRDLVFHLSKAAMVSLMFQECPQWGEH